MSHLPADAHNRLGGPDDSPMLAPRLAIVPAAPAVTEGFPVLCKAWGETDVPAAFIAYSREEVRQFLLREWHGVECPELDEAMARFDADRDDGDAWDGTDSIDWQFEIGGVSLTRCYESSIRAAAPQPPAVPAEPAEPLKGWKLNHARRGDEEGTAEIGYFDPEDDRFSPIVTVDTGLYYQPNQALPLAVQILALLEKATAPQPPAPTAQPLDDFGRPIVYDTEAIDNVTHALTGDEGEDDSVTVLERMAAYVQNVWPGRSALEVLLEYEEKALQPPAPAAPREQEPSDERATFEAWAHAEGFNTDRDDSEKYRDYHRATTRWAWKAWQASRAIGRGRPGESAPAPAAPLTQAAADVLAERRRQVEVEGWTPEHDDEHKSGGMAVAAACYAAWSMPSRPASEAVATLWPWTGWAREWFKPKDTRHNLIRAAALLLAEIERLDRAGGIGSGA